LTDDNNLGWDTWSGWLVGYPSKKIKITWVWQSILYLSFFKPWSCELIIIICAFELILLCKYYVSGKDQGLYCMMILLRVNSWFTCTHNDSAILVLW